MSKEFHHVTVLLHETIDMLDVKPDGIYVDATLGGAGHSEYLLTKLNESGHLYAFDQDQHAIENAKIRLAPFIEKGMVTFIKDNFRHLKERLNELGVTEIMIIGHTDCGVQHMDSDMMIHHMMERGISKDHIDMMRYCGIDFESWLSGFDDTEKAVHESVELVQHHPLIPSDIVVRGFIMNSVTGELTQL